jgi:hypothetical protein
MKTKRHLGYFISCVWFFALLSCGEEDIEPDYMLSNHHVIIEFNNIEEESATCNLHLKNKDLKRYKEDECTIKYKLKKFKYNMGFFSGSYFKLDYPFTFNESYRFRFDLKHNKMHYFLDATLPENRLSRIQIPEEIKRGDSLSTAFSSDFHGEIEIWYKEEFVYKNSSNILNYSKKISSDSSGYSSILLYNTMNSHSSSKDVEIRISITEIIPLYERLLPGSEMRINYSEDYKINIIDR